MLLVQPKYSVYLILHIFWGEMNFTSDFKMTSGEDPIVGWVGCISNILFQDV